MQNGNAPAARRGREEATNGTKPDFVECVAKTRFRGKPAAFLIHIEHQAQPDPNLTWRMLDYLLVFRKNESLPVYPIAVLSHPQPAGKSPSPITVRFPNKLVLLFDFDVVDLAAMNGESYVQSQNPAAMALAARMQTDPEKRVDFSFRFLMNLYGTPVSDEDRKAIRDFFAEYQPLSPEQALQLDTEIGKVTPDATREALMNFKTAFIELGKQRGLQEGLRQGLTEGLEQGLEKGLEQGLEKGLAQGREQGLRQGKAELAIKLLTRRLGALTGFQQKSIRELPMPTIEALGEALLDLNSRADLTRWLKKNKYV